MKKITLLFSVLLVFALSGNSQGLENFNNSNATSAYTDNNFVGEGGITWYYVQSRDANGDANGSGISLPALMLRYNTGLSRVYSESVEGGIGNFSIKLYKGFTGAGNRQVELFINDVSYGTSTPFDDYAEHVFTVNNINVTGNIVIRINNITTKQVIVDDITWTAYAGTGVDNPTFFTAATAGTDQIDLSWTQNANTDNVMVAYTLDGIFGTPVDATTYNLSDPITGGGTVIYNGSGTSTSHTGLTANTQYFYKAWSVDGTTTYSSGVSTDTTTLADEPTTDATSLPAVIDGPTAITIYWTDATGAPDNYLIKGSDVGYASIVDPFDGTPEANSALVQNVAAGVETFQFTGLTPGTIYYFQIYPYNGDNGSVNYKIDIPAQISETTDSFTPPNVFISEYIEGSSNNKAIEIYNGTGGVLDLTGYSVKLAGNGGPWSTTLDLTGSLNPGEVYVIANSSAAAIILAKSDVTSSVTFFNGDDAIGLFFQGVFIDGIGVQGVDPGTGWAVAGIANATVDKTLVRKLSITTGNTNWASSAGTDATDSEWIVFTLDHFYNLGVFGAGWSGLTDNDWATATNWDVQVPSATVNALINAAANQPTISAESNCNNLTLESAASLIISTNNGLNVYGNMVIDPAATFTINSDVAGAGSLITQGTVSGNATVQRYIGEDEWHLISTPVAGETAALFMGDYLQTYDETDGTWSDVVSAATPLEQMKGYALWGTSAARATTYDFVGTPGTGVQTFDFTAVNANGWNLVGNPYPSGIDWDLVTINDAQMNNAVYYLDATTGNYLSYLGTIGGGSQYIPPMQGFWISAITSGTLTFTDAVRTHSGTNIYYKNEEITSNYIELQVQGGDMVDKTYIRLNEEATAVFDGKYDAYKLMAANKNYPQLFTIAADDRLSINQLPATDVIPLGFYVENSGNYTISLNEMTDIQNCQLEDLKTGTLQDLQQGSYTFNYTLGETENRFLLHLTAASVSQSGAEKNVKIYAVGQEIFVKSANPIEKGILRITDLAGRTMAEETIINDNFIRLNTNLKSGIYLVSIVESNNLRTEKIIIN